MAQNTMTEKDAFLQAFEREFQTTLKVLKAYPPAKSELKPAEKSKPARELAWMLVLNQMVLVPTLEGKLEPGSLPPAPKDWSDLVAALEKAHRETTARLQGATDAELNGMIPIPTGPKQMGQMRIGDALWFFLNDTIHHRGQFSIYLRMAGGKLPSIYGPTADEPWF